MNQERILFEIERLSQEQKNEIYTSLSHEFKPVIDFTALTDQILAKHVADEIWKQHRVLRLDIDTQTMYLIALLLADISDIQNMPKDLKEFGMSVSSRFYICCRTGKYFPAICEQDARAAIRRMRQKTKRQRRSTIDDFICEVNDDQ